MFLEIILEIIILNNVFGIISNVFKLQSSSSNILIATIVDANGSYDLW